MFEPHKDIIVKGARDVQYGHKINQATDAHGLEVHLSIHKSQIMGILKQADSGVPIPDLCREHGMSAASFYKWRAKFGGMDTSMMKRMKELEAENQRLKKMYAESKIGADIPKGTLAEKY